MKTWLALVGAAALMLAVASGPASAQEMSVRSGVVIAVAPVQVAREQPASPAASRTGGMLGRAMGRIASRAAARVSGEYAYDAAVVAYDVTEETVTAATSPGAGAGRAATTTAWLVMVRFPDGQESSIQVADAANLRAGVRVRVLGSGSGVRIVPY